MGLPLSQRRDVIVSVERLHAALVAVPGARATPVVVNASWSADGVAHEYLAGHLPGAIHFDTDRVETGYPRWALRPLPELQQTIGAAGIGPGTSVVVYGAQTIAAARLWWALMYAGVHDVRYLDGGLAAWTAAGFAIETDLNTLPPQVFDAPARAHFLIGTDELRARIDDPLLQLGDTRGRAEFLGLSSGYDYVALSGRLPHAIAVEDADDAATIYQRRDGTLQDPASILERWQRDGLQPQTGEIVFYCGTGWRSSLAFLYAHALGFEHIRNYSDSWIGWSTIHKRDALADGPTPGWRQLPSGNPVESGISRQ